MSTPTLRPTVCWPTPLSPEEAIERIASVVARGDHPVVAQRAGRHMTLTVSPALRHFWSPWMDLEFDREADHTPDRPTTVHARFSPAPSIWTGFMMLYVTLATTAFFGVMFAVSQWMTQSPPTMLWITLACLAGCGGLWWVSWTGQRIARDQMHLLRDIVEQELDVKREPSG